MSQINQKPENTCQNLIDQYNKSVELGAEHLENVAKKYGYRSEQYESAVDRYIFDSSELELKERMIKNNCDMATLKAKTWVTRPFN